MTFKRYPTFVFVERAILTPCNNLKARRLTRPSEQATEIVDTNTVTITLEGRLLPKHFVNNGLLIIVRKFYHKPILCDTCQSFGHTNKFCRRKAKCSKPLEHYSKFKPHALHSLLLYTRGRKSQCAYFKDVADRFNKQSRDKHQY